MVGEVGGVSESVMAGLKTADYRVRQLVRGEQVRSVSADRIETPFDSVESVREAIRLALREETEQIGGVLNLLPLSRAAADATADAIYQTAIESFYLAKAVVDPLNAAAAQGGGWLVNVTGIDGRLGLSGQSHGRLVSAGTLGIFKSVAREYTALSVKNVDVDPSAPSAVLCGRLLDELAIDDDELEVGLDAGGRWVVRLQDEPTDVPAPSEVFLDEQSVVLITGGAYGITAEIARELATAARCRLILVGRSPLPQPEADDTRRLDTPGLRKHLIEQARAAGEKILPAEIENQVQRILKARTIRENIEMFRKAGATVEYHAIDVRNETQFGGLIDDLYDRFGRIDGVIHGAGVIRDKRLRDKTPEMFADVFRTKVDSALLLERKIRPETLKFMIFFSSVSGRFGNAGQVDYSTANDFLNKLAAELDQRWPARVVAVNWGPWDAGMVSDELRRLYASKGIHLIPVAEGIRLLRSEIDSTGPGRPEVVISCSVDTIAAGTLGG